MPRTMVLRVGDREFTAYVDERAGNVSHDALDVVERAIRSGAGY